MRRAVVAGFAAAAVLVLAAPAGAHALLEDSRPADGATVDRAPNEVVLSFSEEPDPKLSTVKVLDAAGADVTGGPAEPAPGNPDTLRATVGELQQGTYTVAWRVVSQVDGHVTAGAFAFGVGVTPAAAPPGAATPATPPPSPLAAAGRWLLYAGLGLLVGAAWVGAAAFDDLPRPVLRVARSGWLTAAAGLAALGVSQAQVAGVALRSLLGTSLGTALVRRAVPLAAVGVLLAAARPAGPRRAHDGRSRVAFGLAGVAGALALLAHATAGHAGAGTWAWAKVLTQWLHMLAAAAWLGGLAALLAGIRARVGPVRAAAVRRFSALAAVAIVAVAATGTARAVNELGSLRVLWATSFGRLVAVKIALFVVLVALGAVNRYRHVRASGSWTKGLQRVGRTEIAVAAVVLLATAVLSQLAPASYGAARADAKRITATGSDFGTTLRVRLVATPGGPGINTFELTLRDYDTRERVDADAVRLRFVLAGDANVSSELDLDRDRTGVWTGRGGNLSIAGAWRITAVVQRGAGSTEIGLGLRVREAPSTVTVNRVPGQPTLYTVTLPAGRSVQIYTDPGRPGPNDVHVTFFGPGGTEMRDVADAAVSATNGGERRDLPVRLFGPGHFVASGTFVAGRLHIEVDARGSGGATLSAAIDDTLTEGG